MELSIFDFSFERTATIEVYEEATFEYNYRAHSTLVLIMAASEVAINCFVKQPDDFFVTKSNDLKRGFIVSMAKYTDASRSFIEVHFKSLGYLLNRRLIEGLQKQSGNVETVIRAYVSNIAIAPSNPNRRIPNLVLGNLMGLSATTDEAFANKFLDDALWEICVKFDIAYDIFLDFELKQFVFEVWQGTDRSDEQTILEPVVFSKEFDNVLNQNYTDDLTDYRTTAVISGDNETVTLTVNDEVTGLARREIYFDEKNLVGNDEQSTTAILTEKATGRLMSEYNRVQAFETDIDTGNSQFVYGVDYAFGYKVSIRNDEIAMIMHTRLVTAIEKYSKGTFTLEVVFGSNVPTPFEKITKKVKQ